MYELRASNANFFYRNINDNQDIFYDENGNEFDNMVYRYISSLSLLTENIKKEEFYLTKDFQFIKENHLGPLRTGERRINQGFRDFIYELCNSSLEIRFKYAIADHTLRFLCCILYFGTVFFIMNFKQTGLILLATLKKKMIENLRLKAENFEGQLESVFDRALLSTNHHSTYVKSSTFKMKTSFKLSTYKSFTSERREEDNFEEVDVNEKTKLNKNKIKKKTILSKKTRKMVSNGSGNYANNADEDNDDQESEFEENPNFVFEDRRERLKLDQSSRKKIAFLIFAPTAAVFFLFGHLAYLLERHMILNSNYLTQGIGYIGQAPKILNYQLNFVYSDFTNKQKKFTLTGKIIPNQLSRTGIRLLQHRGLSGHK